MKTKIQILMPLFALMAWCSSISYATTHVILVGQGGLTFSPAAISTVIVGDTIRWEWVAGSHTTDTSGANAIPLGAQPWSASINSNSKVFDYKVTVAGVYNYKCNPHAGFGMKGSFTASDPIAAGIDRPTSINGIALICSPNPFVGNIHVNITSASATSVDLILCDSKGIQVKAYSATVIQGENDYVLDLPKKLPSGIYILNGLVDGKAVTYTKVIKE